MFVKILRKYLQLFLLPLIFIIGAMVFVCLNDFNGMILMLVVGGMLIGIIMEGVLFEYWDARHLN